MKNDKGLWGLRLELIGLFIIFLTIVWQISFTNWFASVAQDWVRYIQEDVNYETLNSLQVISTQVAENNPERRAEMARDVYDRLTKARSKLIDERDKRDKFITNGQYSFFMTIHAALLVLGALMMVVGKWMNLKAYSIKNAAEQPFQHPTPPPHQS
jgi:hypothetical protein